MRKLGAFVGLALSVAFVGHVQAQEAEPVADPSAPAPMPAPEATGVAAAGAISPSLVARGVHSAAAGKIAIRTLVGVNASKEMFAKPFSIAPDIFYSIDDKLQVGLVHNGPMGQQTWPGAGLCLAGKENGCGKVWNNVGFDALYSLMNGATDLSAHGALYLMTVADPMMAGLAVGVAGKHHINDQMAVFFDPSLYIGATKRDLGNKERLYIPVEFQYQLQPQLALIALTGLQGPLSKFGDSFIIPLGVGALYNVNEMIDVGGNFSFINMLGKNSSADLRAITILANIRL